MSYFRRTFIALVVLLVIAFGVFLAGINMYTDWLWFKDVQAGQVFWTILSAKIWVRLVIGAFFALFIYVNLFFTQKKILEFTQRFTAANPFKVVGKEYEGERKPLLTRGRLHLLSIAASIILGFLSSSIGSTAWETVLQYLNRSPFGTTDPIFTKDIGFYIFELPFFQLAYSLLSGLVVLTGIIVGVIYLLMNVRFGGGGYRLNIGEKLHLATLAVFFFILKAFGYMIQMYRLVYSPRGAVFGASYTDIHVQLMALKVLMWVVGLLALFTLVNVFTRNMKLIYIGVAAWLVVAVVLGGIYPEIVQKYQVEPNEIKLESPYIQHNIKYTQQAFGLDKIVQRPFDLKNNLTANDMEDAADIVQNIRLWDWRPLERTYSQLQEIRPYYSIDDVDIDRYTINGLYRQVMIAPRELNVAGLEDRAKTWINETLKFTHGMGVVMSPVNVVTPEGMPELYIKNIPPVSTVDMEINQPRIYFGEKTDNYIIANTKDGEIDYTGATNYYDGSTGIQLNNIWRRVAFAIKYNTVKLLLSSDIQDESKLLFDRNIRKRVAKIAPFLSYDRDPYIVVNEGGLYWIIDGYTTSSKYPYSEPLREAGNINYIRNSVKAVVDAYNGTVDFYISDPNDPLIQTYAKIFPGIFKSFEQMPEGLKQHVRYPEDLFTIQAKVYSTYHMENPVTFFNKEDMWNIPKEKYGESVVTVEPYYMITRLPGEEDQQFALIQPYTPATKDTMVAWLVAKSDPEEFGQLVVYNFPKDRTIYGPMMVEARIDQNSYISQQLTLWDQKGSNVIRGNLLTIPIQDSILYVEPIYLESASTQLPELKRVIVAYGDEIVMEETLELALQRVFGLAQVPAPVQEPFNPVELGETPTEWQPLVQRAQQLYTDAQDRLKAGDLGGYQTKINEIGQLLEQLASMQGE